MDTDIPAFLRIPQDKRKDAWKGKRLRPTVEMTFKVENTEPPDVKAFRIAHEKREKEKQEMRFALLRERAAEQKRLKR